MKRYGEIARFDCGSYMYIMDSIKHMSRFGEAVWLNFYISRRTSKKRGMKNKYEARYALGSDGGLRAIRYFMTFLKQYLDTYKPDWLAICPAEDENTKRTDFYCRQLDKLGYRFICRDRDADGNLMEWVDLYQRCV